MTSPVKYVMHVQLNPGADLTGFTANEVMVTELIARGHTGAELARRAYLCKSSTETTARRVAVKLGATSRANLVYLAMKAGLIT